MKKDYPISPKHQARREGALARFSIKAGPGPKASKEAEAEYDAYVVRKEAERQTLIARLQRA